MGYNDDLMNNLGVDHQGAQETMPVVAASLPWTAHPWRKIHHQRGHSQTKEPPSAKGVYFLLLLLLLLLLLTKESEQALLNKSSLRLQSIECMHAVYYARL